MITLDQLESLGDKEFRHLYVSDRIRELIAAQIREMREQRNWSQEELGERAGMAQARVSLLEDPDYAAMTLKTLKRIGEAFDVALLVEYVSFKELLERTARRERLTVPDFDANLTQLRRNGVHVVGNANAYSSTVTASSGGSGFHFNSQVGCAGLMKLLGGSATDFANSVSPGTSNVVAISAYTASKTVARTADG